MGFNDLSPYNKYIVSRWAYSVGKPVISDAEYQILRDTMKQMYPTDVYVTRTWSDDPCPVELLQQIGRKDLIETVTLTDRTTSIESLGNLSEIRRDLENISTPGTLSMKHDGWNIQANYYNENLVNVHTRGRSSDVVDVSFLRERFPQKIPVGDKVKVVCELTCPKKNYLFCARTYGNVNERSAVSTLLAHPEHHDLLEFHAVDVHGISIPPDVKFNVLKAWGFETPAWFPVTTYDELLNALNTLSEEEASYGSPTDGAVYDGELRRALRVFAWEEPIFKSYVTGYLEQFAANRISPSVCICPVFRKGVNQKRVNLTNWQRIIMYDLEPGAPIAFKIASDAIAAFDEYSTKLLHDQYLGRWAEYKEMIDENERLVRTEWKQLLSSE